MAHIIRHLLLTMQNVFELNLYFIILRKTCEHLFLVAFAAEKPSIFLNCKVTPFYQKVRAFRFIIRSLTGLFRIAIQKTVVEKYFFTYLNNFSRTCTAEFVHRISKFVTSLC